jgi:hypothetical protein
MCGQTVPYHRRATGRRRPGRTCAPFPALDRTWATGICNAVIIESIQPDGTVKHFRQSSGLTAEASGQSTLRGKSSGKHAELRRPQNSIDFYQTTARGGEKLPDVGLPTFV